MYTIFEVKNKQYELNFRMRDIEKFEKIRKHNPLDMLMNIDNGQMPTYSDMVVLLAISLEKFNHGIDLEKAKDLFDDWCEDGHAITDFINVIVELFQSAGLIKKTADENDNE